MIKKILKIALWVALSLGAVCGLFYLLLLLHYGSSDPVSDITGCYSGQVNGIDDKFCIYPSGRYEQFSPFQGKEETKYNEGLWKSNTYIRQDTDYVNGVLVGYVHIDENGDLVKSGSINIRPYENEFGLVVARVHNITTGERVAYTHW